MDIAFTLIVLFFVMYLESESKKEEKVTKTLLVREKVIPETNIYNSFEEWLEYIKAQNRIKKIQETGEDIEAELFLINANIIKPMY